MLIELPFLRRQGGYNYTGGYNYIVAPLTLEYNIFKKIHIGAGITNNFFLGHADPGTKKILYLWFYFQHFIPD